MEAYEIRRKARETLESNFLISILAGAIASSLGGLLTGASVTFSFNFQSGFQFNFGTEPFSEFSAVFIVIFILFFCFIIIYSLVYSVLGGVIQLGYAQFLLKQQDDADYNPRDMFSQFYRTKEGFLQFFLRDLYSFLWSLLLIVPGIIKSYSYAMAPFIMAENPSMTAREAIHASKILMDGHKADLFWLNLSFIGWEILAGFTFGTGYFIINPYKNTAYAIFYRNITKPVLTDSPEYL